MSETRDIRTYCEAVCVLSKREKGVFSVKRKRRKRERERERTFSLKSKQGLRRWVPLFKKKEKRPKSLHLPFHEEEKIFTMSFNNNTSFRIYRDWEIETQI